MVSIRNAKALQLLPVLALLLATTEGWAQAPPAAEWKVFQEFGFASGSWAGPAESAGRVGGRVVSFQPAVGGAQLSYRATTFYPAKESLPESSTEEVAYIVYDGGRGKYAALVVFSTKVWGIFDAEVRPDGAVVFTSREMANMAAGVRARWTLARKEDGSIAETIEVAPNGTDFAPFVTSTLAKK